MAGDRNPNQGKQNGRNARIAEAAEANFDKAADKTNERDKRFADGTRDGVRQMNDLRDKATGSTKQAVQDSIYTASQPARESADRFTRTLGFSGADSERLAQQSKQNLETVTRCDTVLNQAFHDASRSLFDLGQKQFQRNLDGLNKLTRARSVQEFTAIQGDLMREGLRHMIYDGKAIADTSARAVDEAGKTFSGVAQAR